MGLCLWSVKKFFLNVRLLSTQHRKNCLITAIMILVLLYLTTKRWEQVIYTCVEWLQVPSVPRIQQHHNRRSAKPRYFCRQTSGFRCNLCFQAILPKINNHDVERGSKVARSEGCAFSESTYTGSVKNIRNVDGYHQKTMTSAYRCQYFENSIWRRVITNT